MSIYNDNLPDDVYPEVINYSDLFFPISLARKRFFLAIVYLQKTVLFFTRFFHGFCFKYF